MTRSPDGTYLASGANDNTLCITDLASMHGQVMNTNESSYLIIIIHNLAFMLFIERDAEVRVDRPPGSCKGFGMVSS
jgi:hypothetical protein